MLPSKPEWSRTSVVSFRLLFSVKKKVAINYLIFGLFLTKIKVKTWKFKLFNFSLIDTQIDFSSLDDLVNWLNIDGNSVIK
ncbi:hypothetical protein [Floridanema aerugineum]|uniref:Uncharacterized protein n=1 Tax=Floridaenema aerugineum BLCC-F46 TaxID=3153654 RepID=A0ABV4X3E2_9CYAN